MIQSGLYDEKPQPMDIDPVEQSQDHLNKLPTEILHRICDYLFPSHDPDYIVPDDNEFGFVPT
jgi:hypothetical protein